MSIAHWVRRGVQRFVPIAATIRRRLDAGLLPTKAPVTTFAGYGWSHPCDACDQPIRPAQVQYDLEYWHPFRVFRLHIGCHGLWEAECRRRRHRRRSWRGLLAGLYRL